MPHRKNAFRRMPTNLRQAQSSQLKHIFNRPRPDVDAIQAKGQG